MNSASPFPATWTASWVPDSHVTQCMECMANFDLLRRRHHCRRCGKCLCDSCTPCRAEGRRVCRRCMSEHTATVKKFNRTKERTNFIGVLEDWFLMQDSILLPGALEERLTQNFDGVLEELFSNRVNIVDLILNTLSLTPKDITNEMRMALMHMLQDVLSYPEGIDQFNCPFFVRFRIDRLKILLYHYNAELPLCESILNMVEYKSILFEKIKTGHQIRYTLILDRSGSMVSHDLAGKSRWIIARDVVEHITEQVELLTKGTPHGITLWMFSSSPHSRYPGLRTREAVERVFLSEHPGGSTDLAGVLQNAFEDHYSHGEQEHILIVTDGEPDSKVDVYNTLVSNINKLNGQDELGLTFMQAGCCNEAAEFLYNLQDKLLDMGAKFSVVDSLTHKDYDGQNLCDIVHKYLPERFH